MVRKSMGEMIRNIPQVISGEISKLRDRGFNFTTRLGSISASYKLDTTHVDYEFARELYKNTADKYKLGAWAAKPIINTTVGFMGTPAFIALDPEAQELLDQSMSQNQSLMQQVHRDTLRDGDCWIWITREEIGEVEALYPELEGVKFTFNIIPPDMIDFDECERDPISGRIIKYVFKSSFEWTDTFGHNRKCEIIEIIDKDLRTRRFEGDVPSYLEPFEEAQEWGFLPIVQFSNEKDVSDAFGVSELEAIEPFMKAYHDVMLHAIEGSKLHSTPKLVFKVQDVQKFMRNNFGIVDLEKHAREGRVVNMDGQDAFLLAEGDDSSYLEVSSSTGDAKTLLKLLFMCIVDVSETPEFAFGVHTPSAQASVKEQMPVLIRKITRKRDHFSESWSMLVRMLLAMQSVATSRNYITHETDIVWDDIDPRDEVEVAKALKDMVEALVKGVGAWLISQEAAVNYLAGYIETMMSFESEEEGIEGERERIVRDKIAMSGGLEDRALMDEERELIQKALEQLGEGDG